MVMKAEWSPFWQEGVLGSVLGVLGSVWGVWGSVLGVLGAVLHAPVAAQGFRRAPATGGPATGAPSAASAAAAAPPEPSAGRGSWPAGSSAVPRGERCTALD